MPVLKKSDSVSQKISSNLERRMSYLNNLMVVVCDFTNGPMPEPDPPHTHPHEQITYVARGKLYLFLGEEKFQLSKGDIFAVPPSMPHCIQTISNHVRLIDSFSPVREDFIRK